MYKRQVFPSGVQSAVETVAKLLEAVPAMFFSLSPRQTDCFVHGNCDGGLAAQLEGRLSALEFRQLSGQDHVDAKRMVEQLQASVKAHVRGPWLCPLGKVYAPVDEEESACSLNRKSERPADTT